jgi:hypothetical protein
MDAGSAAGQTYLKNFTWALPKRLMVKTIVDLVEIFGQLRVQLRERPCGEALWVYGLRHLPNVARDLGVASQVMDELRIRDAEHSL